MAPDAWVLYKRELPLKVANLISLYDCAADYIRAFHEKKFGVPCSYAIAYQGF